MKEEEDAGGEGNNAMGGLTPGRKGDEEKERKRNRGIILLREKKMLHIFITRPLRQYACCQGPCNTSLQLCDGPVQRNTHV